MTLKPARIGSISHGTLRSEDLINAFRNEIEWQLNRNGDYFSRPENFSERDKLNNLVGECQDLWADDDDIIPDRFEEAVEMVNETLPNALEQFCPPYCYFGSHCGDGSDFGYWPSMDSIDELPQVEGSDEAKELGEDCKSVNDHGNVTIYSATGEIILELV